MSGSTQGDGVDPSGVEPDAVGRGWIDRGGPEPEPALFFVSGTSLGVGDLVGGSSPGWIEFADITNLDALGDPDGTVQTVEMTISDGRVVLAGWPLAFCDHVVRVLQSTLPAIGSGSAPSAGTAGTAAPSDAGVAPPSGGASALGAAPATVGAAPGGPAPSPAPAPSIAPAPALSTAPPHVPAPPPSAAPAVPSAPVAPSGTGPEAPPLPGPGGPSPVVAPLGAPGTDGGATPAAALVLEDVTYLGGYPGQSKKRKKCTATLTRDAVEVAGPNGLSFRVPWEVIRTIEAQNADEARFRMNTKVHRDATALVMECDQGVTVLLEARDCPTIPLRGAIAQLVTGMQVVVV